MLKWKQVQMVVLLLMVSLLCSGCLEDKKEMNQLALAQTAAIDRKGELFQLTLQIIIPRSGEESITAENLWILQGEGESVGEALEQLSYSAPRQIYLGQLNMILVGESVLEKELSSTFSYLIQQNLLRRRTYFLAVEGEASEILKAKPELGKVDVFYLSNLIQDQERRIPGSSTLINDCLMASEVKEEGLFIPAVQQISEKELELVGGALVKNDALVAWADQAWTDSYYWLHGKITSGALVLHDVWNQGDRISMDVEQSSYRFKLVQEKPLKVEVSVKTRLNVTENSGNENIRNVQELQQMNQQLKEEAEKQIKKNIEQALRQAQRWNCDAFGLQRWMNAYHPSLVQSLDWAETFPKIEFNVKVDSNIKLLMMN